MSKPTRQIMRVSLLKNNLHFFNPGDVIELTHVLGKPELIDSIMDFEARQLSHAQAVHAEFMKAQSIKNNK